MSAFGFYEKDEAVETIRILAEELTKQGKSPRETINSIMEAVSYGIDLAMYNILESEK